MPFDPLPFPRASPVGGIIPLAPLPRIVMIYAREAVMNAIIRLADKKGRVCLPGFANATVILEAVSANEYRVRKAEVIPADEVHFPEEDMPTRLSKRDAGRFLEALR